MSAGKPVLTLEVIADSTAHLTRLVLLKVADVLLVFPRFKSITVESSPSQSAMLPLGSRLLLCMIYVRLGAM